MSSFERFRDRNSKRMEARENLNTSFIFKGYPTTILTNEKHVFKNEREMIITTTVRKTI